MARGTTSLRHAARWTACLTTCGAGFRVLADLGVKTIIVAADHGHLFGEEIGEDMKIEAPGGETADLHRRVWVGVGGTSEPSYLRTSLESLGVDSDLDIATPWTLACFKSKGGARAYFHGGLSPQELIIPVVVDDRDCPGTGRSADGHRVEADARDQRSCPPDSSRSRSAGQITGLFGMEPPEGASRDPGRARRCVSDPVSASYGFEDATGEVKLRLLEDDPKQIEPNTVTLMIDGRSTDAEDGRDLPPRCHQRRRTGESWTRSKYAISM